MNNEKSDIDFLISLKEDLAPGEYTNCFWNIYFSLPEILDRQVDIVLEETVTNPFFEATFNEAKVLIYESKS